MQATRKKGNTGSVYKVINMFPLSAVYPHLEHPFVWVVTQNVVEICREEEILCNVASTKFLFLKPLLWEGTEFSLFQYNYSFLFVTLLGVRYFAPFHTGPNAHQNSCTYIGQRLSIKRSKVTGM